MKNSHKFFAVMAALLLSTSFQSSFAGKDKLKCSGCVGAGDIAKNAVTGSKIKNKAVTEGKIKDGAVSMDKLGSDVRDILLGNPATVDVDCSADSSAFANLELTNNTYYVVTGICDGPVDIRGRRSIGILGDGVGVDDDGISLPDGLGSNPRAAVVISASTDIFIDDLVITAFDSANTASNPDGWTISALLVENASFVELENVTLSGGDTGINVQKKALARIMSDVSVENFRKTGGKVSSGAMLNISGPTPFTGSATSINDTTSGLAALGGTILIDGIADGTVVTPTTSLLGADFARALTAVNAGSITIEANTTINGAIVADESGDIHFSAGADVTGNLWAYASAAIRFQSASTIQGNIFAAAGGNIEIDNSTVDDGAGCCLFIEDNGIVIFNNTTYTGASITVNRGSVLSLLNSDVSFNASDFRISGGSSVTIQDSDVSGTGIVISRYGTLTLEGSGGNIDLNGTNITCTDAEGYDNSGLTPLNPGTVNCP